MVTRRQLMAVAGTIGAAVIVGCLGGDDSEADQPTPEDHGFAVDDLVFTVDRAQSYGEYTAVDEASYRVGDIIWIYVELENVTPTSEGDQFDTEWEVIGPDGGVLDRTEESIHLPDDPGDPPNSVFITQGIATGLLDIHQSGEYAINIEITDIGSDESVSVAETVRIERLAFDTLSFTDGEPRGFDDYDEHPEATYERGETVWIYTEVKHVPVNTAGNAIVEYTFTVTDPDGDQWDPITHSDEWERVDPEEILSRWQSFSTFPDDPTGTYELTITVEDGVAGHRIESTETFELV